MEHVIKEKVVKMLNACEDRVYEEMAKFGAYFGAKYGISPSTAISLILGCVCLFMFVKRRWWRSKGKRILHRSESIARLYGGDLALRRLDDYNAAKAIPCTLDHGDNVLKGLLEEEHLDLKKLQSVTARLEMAGKEEEAVKILQEAKAKNVQWEKSHHVYEIDMLLAEMLIYLGKYNEAQECECLKHQKMLALDARRPLFKAIIYGMQQKWEKAESFWNKFIDLRQRVQIEVGREQVAPEIENFAEFKERVQHLQNDIVKKKKA